ncbi:unnamed protein product [Phaeothamnion confervicola]
MKGSFAFAAFVLGCNSTANAYEYIPSNCITVGGGSTGAKYQSCTGCLYATGQACLADMRANVSRNVPDGCDMSALTVQSDRSCCPVLDTSNSKKITMDSTTTAYPDALLCLQQAGCESSALYQSLYYECVFQGCVVTYACVPTVSAAPAAAPALFFLALLVQVAVCLHLG